MTVSSTTGKAGPTTGNGVATSFPFDFKVFAATDLQVVLADVASGAETTLTLDSDYSVTLNPDQDSDPGGSVTYPLSGSPMTNASTLTIVADLDVSQPTDITNGGGFYADVVEKMVDRCVMLVRQVNDTVSRALKLAVSTPDGVSADLPVPVANNVLGWNADGTGFKNFAPVDNTLLSATLAAANGATRVGWTPNDAGAQTTDVGNALSYQSNGLHVFRWIPPTEWAAILAGTSTYDATAALQSCLNTRQGYVPRGLFLTDTLIAPNDPAGSQDALSFVCQPGAVFQLRTANTPLLKKELNNGAVDGARIGPFIVKPHASGSTTAAILCTGFRNTLFDNIRGISNGTAGMAALFDVSAYPYLCYSNTFRRPTLQATTGWSKMFDFNSGGTGNAANNANVQTIEQPWVYANSGMTTVFDCLRSANVTIKGGLVEGNTGALAVSSGNSTHVIGTWFEANGTDFDYNSAADGSANTGLVMGCYFSTAHNVDFHNAQLNNLWIGNTEAGAQTFVNNGSNTNVKIAPGGVDIPGTIPTFAYLAGQTGTLTQNSTNVVSNANQLTGRITYKFNYTWTAGAAATNSEFEWVLPTGYEVESMMLGVTRNASGEPAKAAPAPDGKFWVYNAYNDAHTITGAITFVKSGY